MVATKDRFPASLRVDWVDYFGGIWPSPKEAAIARDRMRLFYCPNRPLEYPDEARALGRASAPELRQEARLRNKRESATSPYVGVSWDRKKKRWEACVNVGGPKENKYAVIGYFDDAREAAALRDRVALHVSGPTVLLNFPHDHPQPLALEVARREVGHVARTKTAKSSSRFRGVQRTPNGHFAAAIVVQRKVHTIGTFDDEEIAARAFDRAAVYLRGPNTRLNFPDERLEPASPEQLRREGRLITKSVTTSRHFGVAWNEEAHAWEAYITLQKKHVFIGHYDDDDDAGLARDAALLHHEPNIARERLNFPEVATRPRSVAELRAELWARFKERTSSRYTGVYWSRIEQRWRAVITIDRVTHHLGVFDTETDAARAYDAEALRRNGPSAFQNFPASSSSRPTPRGRRPRQGIDAVEIRSTRKVG